MRVGELQELSHHGLVQYRLPTTGELVTLLQIALSKTGTERLMLVSPELADVLSAIICRVRVASEAILWPVPMTDMRTNGLSRLLCCSSAVSAPRTAGSVTRSSTSGSPRLWSTHA